MTFKEAVRNAKYKSDELYRTMVNNAIADYFEFGTCFYGYMYGAPYLAIYQGHELKTLYRKDKIIRWDISKVNPRLNPSRTAIWAVWGWPGGDFNLYDFCDYGITWAFVEDEIEGMTYGEWMAYQKSKELSIN